MGSTSGTKSLKEYLKRYESNNNQHQKKAKKKRTKPAAAGVLIVDEDPIWQKPINLEQDSGQESAGDDNPQVEEDMEVKRLRKLEQLKARSAYNSIAEDGSGWNSWERVSSEPKDSNQQNIHLSPARRQTVRNDTPSPEYQEIPSAIYRENIDLSPPRKRRTGVTHVSPKRDTKHAPTSGLNSDLSPPRKQCARNDTLPPDLDWKHLKDSRDLSPLQQQHKQNYSPLPQPVEKSVHSTGLNYDLSPPRKQGARHDTPSSSSRSENHASHNVDADASLGPDLSPQRNSRNVSSIPPRSRKRSLEKNTEQAMPKDLSPRRKYQKQSFGVSSSKEKPKTGLITGRDMREEIARKKKEDLLRIEQMDPFMSGRGAEGVHRDKKGDRISKEEYIKSKQKVEEKPKEKKLEWGKGLAQKREAEARLDEFEHEKDQPFARTRDDPQLDKMLKERLRWGDPMAHLVKNKNSELVLADLGDSDKMKESGFIIPQEIPSHSWLKRGLDAAPNRYGIRPGRHWDGVDRSNGYEKQSFKRKNEKQATEKEAYMWSVSDM